jgi:hypothetical protein
LNGEAGFSSDQHLEGLSRLGGKTWASFVSSHVVDREGIILWLEKLSFESCRGGGGVKGSGCSPGPKYSNDLVVRFSAFTLPSYLSFILPVWQWCVVTMRLLCSETLLQLVGFAIVVSSQATVYITDLPIFSALG